MDYNFMYRLRTKNTFDHADITSSLGLRAEFDYPNSERDHEGNWTYFILDPKKNIIVREKTGLVELTEEAYNAGLWDLEELSSGFQFKKIRKHK